MLAETKKMDFKESEETNEGEEFQFFVGRMNHPQDEKSGSPRSRKPAGKEDRAMETETGK